MQTPDPPPRTMLALPDWLNAPVGRAALGLAGGAALVRILGATEVLPIAIADACGAAIALLACAFARREFTRLSRSGRIPAELRVFWRLQRFSVLAVAAAVVGWISSRAVPEAAAPALRLASLGLSMTALGVLLTASVRIPGSEISRRHRVTASLDLATLIIAGLIGFWILSLKPAVLGLHGSGPAASASGDGTVLAGLLLVAVIALFAFLSLLLTSTLLLLPFRSHGPAVARGLRVLATGVVALVAAEIVPYCIGLAYDGFTARPVFIGWTLFALGAGVHARLARTQPDAPAVERPAHVRVAMPHAAIGLLTVLVLTGLTSREVLADNAQLFLFTIFAAFILVVVRQTVIARENYGLALEMQRAKEVAESANSARLQFLANISHDLRTPLNGVLGCAQILLREKTMTSKQRELLKTMQGCAEHLRNLINDLLDLSKLEADRLELAPSPFDLRAFIQALIKTFTLEAENKKIILEFEEAGTLPGWISCDRKRLQQILGNLVHNAIKFTDHGRVKVRVRAGEGTMIFDVIDTGCGILPHKLGELFQPFHVVDERSIKLEGTGLGLSICKKLAKKMGGDIVVHSTVGKGSTFTVTIPLVESEAVIEVQRTVVDYQGRRRRVLIVDDNPANRVVLRTMLEPLDFLIHEAGDARETHEQIRFARPDIILMDLMMPGIDGFVLCQQVAELEILPPPAVIAVSAMAGEDVLDRCRKAGFADLLHKPVHLDQLVEALRAHAGIEWTYGVLQPAPAAPEDAPGTEPIVAPPIDELTAFLDLARRGVVRNIETRAELLARTHPEYTPFARRVARYAREFKMKELGEWLASLYPQQQPHGSA